MRKVMRTSMCYCEDIQSFLTFPTTDIAETGLILLCLGSPAEAAPMASISYILAVLVDSDGAFGTLDYGVAELAIIAEAGRAWRPQHGLFALVVLGLLLLQILL
jgi:hypothetical protein